MELLTLIIASAAPTVAIIASFFLARKKIEEIHVLVNSQHEKLVAEIAVLKKEREEADE